MISKGDIISLLYLKIWSIYLIVFLSILRFLIEVGAPLAMERVDAHAQIAANPPNTIASSKQQKNAANDNLASQSSDALKSTSRRSRNRRRKSQKESLPSDEEMKNKHTAEGNSAVHLD